MKLKQLLSGLDRDGAAVPDLLITGVCDHSDRVRPGNLFVAIRGFETDGHNYIEQAVAKGAVAVVAEKATPATVPVFIVKDTRVALAKISKTWFSFPSTQMKLIGVTASNGKTTTAFMIDSILSRAHPRTGLIGTVVVKDGLVTVGAGLTTPNALELYEILGRMETNGCAYVTMEVSSAGQELNRIHGLTFDVVTFNNITREHIDFHGSFEKYWATKTGLVRNLPATAIAVLNADDAAIYGLQDQTQANCITYSLKSNPADIQVTDIDLSTGEGRFRYTIPKPIKRGGIALAAGSVDLALKVLGLHNIYNATVAITVGKLLGVLEQDICSALADFGGVERRFQLIYDREFKVIDDHFANTGNIDLTLATLGLMKYRLLHLLIAIRGSRGPVVNKENTETLVKWLPLLPFGELILTDSIDYAGAHDTVLPEERQAVLNVLDSAGIRYSHYPRLDDAIAAVLGFARPGDVVLMGGCQGLDPGAHIIVPQLAKRFSPLERKNIMQILQGRVAGSSINAPR